MQNNGFHTLFFFLDAFLIAAVLYVMLLLGMYTMWYVLLLGMCCLCVLLVCSTQVHSTSTHYEYHPTKVIALLCLFICCCLGVVLLLRRDKTHCTLFEFIYCCCCRCVYTPVDV